MVSTFKITVKNIGDAFWDTV